MNASEMRELDAWVAEHVMGWELRECKWGWGIWIGKGDDLVAIPNYTTDPAAAMEVLKKCAEKCLEFSDEVVIARTDSVWSVRTLWTVFTADATTIELAICLFAKELFQKEKQ